MHICKLNRVENAQTRELDMNFKIYTFHSQ